MTLMRIIDADGHVNAVPVMERFCELLDPPFRRRARPSPQNPHVMLVDGVPWPSVSAGAPGGAAAAAAPRQDASVTTLLVRGISPMAGWNEQPALSGMWDPHKRIQDMDVDGIEAAALFPGRLGMGAPGHRDPAMATALCRAYNSWLAEYCRPYPQRLKGIIVLPIQDVEAAIAELQRCSRDFAFVAATVPTWLPYLNRNLDDRAYDPLWDAAERMDIPICVHANLVYGSELEARLPAYVQKKPIHDPMLNMVAIQCLIFGGVMDRFPRLKFAFMESGAGWVPFWIDRLGEYYEEFLEGKVKHEPRAYFTGGQCYFSCEPDESTIPYVAQVVGHEHLLYASDYLHHDAKFPGSMKPIQQNTALSDEARANILGLNAVRLYHL